MNISRIKAIWALVTSGWPGLAQYVLEAVNAALSKCDVEKCKKTASVAISAAAIVKVVCDVFAPEKYKSAAADTVAALETLAGALEDGVLTKDELDSNVDAISKCIETWKEV